MGMTLSEFLSHAESSRKVLSDVKVPRAPSSTRGGDSDESVPFGDGPPCLQHLTAQGFPEGTRNNGLFALGIYCQKKFPEEWKDKLEEMNRLYMTPPLSAEEVVGVTRSLEKKEYNYSCRDVPLCTHCESVVCRGRKFGVGGGGQFPAISGLSKLATNPPIWFMDIEGERVELSTRELQNYRDFQSVCMDRLTIFFMPMKHETWSQMVGEAMQSAVIIEAAADMSTEGHFMELLEAFLMDRHRGERWEDIHQGRPFMDPETNIHWFRLKDLMSLLDREGFREWGRNKVGQFVEQIGHRKGKNISGKFVNLLGVPDSKLHATPAAVIPDPPRDPI